LKHDGREADAEPLLRRAVAIQEKTLGPKHLQLAWTLNNLANTRMNAGQDAEAEALFRRVMVIREQAAGPASTEYALALYGLAGFLALRDRPGEAAPLVARAVQVAEQAGEKPDRIARYLVLRAQLAWKDGRKDEALESLRRAMELSELQRGLGSGSAADR